jgi:hypothetical protein
LGRGPVSGSKNSHIVTLVERHSRFTALIKVSDKETATVVAALPKRIRKRIEFGIVFGSKADMDRLRIRLTLFEPKELRSCHRPALLFGALLPAGTVVARA